MQEKIKEIEKGLIFCGNVNSAEKTINKALSLIEELRDKIFELESNNVALQKCNQWNQDKLRDIFYIIKKHGDNPEEYIDLYYSVSEEKFNNWPEHIKNIFKPAEINN